MRIFLRLAAVALVVSTYSQSMLMAQTHPAPPPTRPASPQALPDNLDASKVSGDPSSTDNNSSTIARGTVYAAELNVPREPMREYQKGMEALQRSDVKSAEQHLLRASELYPKFSSAFNALGVAYELDPEKQAAARSAFRQAVALNPNNDKALINLGYILLREKDSAEAERVLRTATAIQPDSPRAYVELMLAQSMQRHYDDVLQTSRRLPHGEESEFPLVYFLRAVAWENKSDRSQAVRDYREFLKLSPEAHEAPVARAALTRLGGN